MVSNRLLPGKYLIHSVPLRGLMTSCLSGRWATSAVRSDTAAGTFAGVLDATLNQAVLQHSFWALKPLVASHTMEGSPMPLAEVCFEIIEVPKDLMTLNAHNPVTPHLAAATVASLTMGSPFPHWTNISRENACFHVDLPRNPSIE